ncbi:MAG: 30S ribosome-binding factor RbfA [Tissierellia bacterium]|nr:30S ribosome-binding factor RbfA [Tissierellia bacterium]
MNEKRVKRISMEIQKVISNAVYHGLRDPRIDSLKTGITDVDVTNDLSFAYVYISIIGDEEEKKETLKGFENARGYLKKLIGEEVDLRHIPQLIFKLDESQERGMHIEKLIDEIRSDE